MKIAVVCDGQAEQFVVEEIKRILGKDAEAHQGFALVEGDMNEAILLCLRSQLASRVLQYYSHGPISKPEDIAIPKPDIQGTFKITCNREGTHQFQARDVQEYLGEAVHKQGHEVSLSKPQTIIHCQVRNDTYVLGIDLAGKDLGKRPYKAFHTRTSLRATAAAAALYAGKYAPGMCLVDPFANDGVIAIEAVLMAGSSPQKYEYDFAFQRLGYEAPEIPPLEETQVTAFVDSLNLLKMARGNAKLSGVEKQLTLTKCEIGWLDTKFEKQTVDLIVTHPPTSGKSTPLKAIERVQDDLFYQAKYVLTPKGKVVLIAEKKAELVNPAQHHGFMLEKDHVIQVGASLLHILVFKR